MNIDQRWIDVDRYIGGLFFGPDAALDEAQLRSRAAGLPEIELVAAEPRVRATTLQTVGSKGYDGVTLAWVES